MKIFSIQFNRNNYFNRIVIPIAAIILFTFFIYPSIYEFAKIAYSRITLEYDLEWEEGLMLTAAHVYGSTGNLYTIPSVNFISTLYPPLYFLFLSLFIDVVSNFYLAGRILSLFFFAGSMYFLYILLKSRYKTPFSIFAALAMFSAYPLSGYWFDVIRVDSCAIFFIMLTGISPLFRIKKQFKPVVVAFLFVLAVFTKQSSLLLVAPLSAYWILKGDIKYFFYQIFITTIFLSAAILYWQLKTDGLFLIYTWEIGNSHKYILNSMSLSIFYFYSFIKQLTPYITFLIFTGTAALAVLLFRNIRRFFSIRNRGNIFKTENYLNIPEMQIRDMYLILFAFALFAMTFLLSIHPGTFFNNNIPMLYGSVILFSISSHFITYPIYKFFSHKKFRIYLKILPFIFIAYFTNSNHSAKKLLALLPDPSVTPEERSEIYRFKKIINIPRSVFASEVSIAPLSDWKMTSGFHSMSLADLRNHPEMKRAFDDSMDKFNCRKYDLIIDSNINNCSHDFIELKINTFGIDTTKLRSHTGLPYFPKTFFIRREYLPEFEKIIDNLSK